MTEDDRIDEIIRNAASDYNRPSATPREEMWTAIQAARQEPGPRLHVTAGGAGSVDAPQRRFGARFAWIGMAAAAAILVATGVGIGRWTTRSAPRQVVEAPADFPAPRNDELPSPTASPAIEQPTEKSSASVPENPPRSIDQIRKDPIIKGTGTVTPVKLPNPLDQNRANVYQVATMRHLADAEAMLTTFTFESKDATMNAKFADWAKGLLSNTRLLLDSPAGDDPRRAKLLQDLELVLAQIVQLSPSAAATDRELIQGTIQEGQVITRLRTAIPASGAREILER